MTSIEVISAVSTGAAPEEWVFRRFWWAGAFIVISAFLDMLDGKLARFFNRTSDFGLSYDSLSDLVSFGVAPAVLVYTWVLMGSGKIGLMAVLFYAVCAALRLARFNVQSGNEERFNFTGLPSPAAAGLMVAPVMLLTALNIVPDFRVVWYFLIAAPVIGLLMVSNVSYSKRPYFNIGGPFNALVVAAIIIAAIITHPEIMFIFIVYLYAVIGLTMYIVKQLRGKTKLGDEAETPDSTS
jgi:CDP-diacylglycerol--serine O-phosphatidyltransferase